MEMQDGAIGRRGEAPTVDQYRTGRRASKKRAGTSSKDAIGIGSKGGRRIIARLISSQPSLP